MQTSSKKLTSNQQQTITKKFISLIADLKKPDECEIFLNSFLTNTERNVFTKRLGIIWMLNNGQSYDKIKKSLHVSSATISTVASQMDQAGIQLAVKKLNFDDWAERWAKKLLKLWPF
jgi:uncharacterized protein YerC